MMQSVTLLELGHQARIERDIRDTREGYLPVRMVVRTSVPWAKMTMAEFHKQDNWLLTPMVNADSSFVRVRNAALVSAWEEAYGRSFFEYRGAIARACAEANALVPVDYRTHGLDDMVWREQDEILLPIDDDDTFEPGVVEAVKRAMVPGVNIVRWPRRWNVLGEDTEDHPFAVFLDTNNFAVRKSYLYQWGIVGAYQFLAFHWVAHAMVSQLGYARPKPVSKGDYAGGQFSFMHGVRTVLAPVSLPEFGDDVVELTEKLSTYYVHTGSISYLDTKSGYRERGGGYDNLVKILKGKPFHPLVIGKGY